MSLFLLANGAMQTTAAFVAVTTGTAIKTMLQIKPASGIYLRVVEWGISFDGSSLATPIKVELIETGTVNATVTAHAEADITKIDDLSVLAASFMTLATSGTGYTSSAEGSITAVRNLDGPQFISDLSQPFVKQFPLGAEPVINAANIGRIRVTSGVAYNCYCWMKVKPG
jgi:hypothetical protein